MRTTHLALLAALTFALGCGTSSGPAVLPNFTIAAAPTTVALQSGGLPRALTVTAGAVNGFSSSVNISLSGLPTGVTASPSTLSLAPGQLGQFMLAASDSTAPISSAMVMVTGSADSTSHTATAAVSISAAPVPDFTVTAAPSSISLQSGGSARSFTVTTSAVNGFSDPVNISLSGLPTGVTATPATLSVTPGQLGQFTLAASTAAGTTSGAAITVTGSAGSLSHIATAALTVMPAVIPDFTVTAAPTSISLQGGGSNRLLTVTTTPVNGFTDPVNIALTGLPAGVTATPSTLSVNPGQLGQFLLSASNSAAATSSATVTVTGSADSISHAATAALSVTPAAVPDFSISAAPSSISLQGGGSNRLLTVTTAAVNGFTDAVNITLSGLPAGVTATPSTLSVTPGQLGQFMLNASASAVTASSATVTVTGSADSLSHTATANLSITPAVSNAAISATSFDFGGNLVGSTLTKSVVTVTNTGISSITLSPTLSGDPSYSLSSATTCATTLAAGSSCSASVTYAPTAASGGSPQTATLSLGLGNVPAGTSQTISLTGVSAALAQGTVTSTNNPQVALYTVTLPFPGSVTINFGTDTSYGRQTWTQSTNTAGGKVSIFVAGMLPNTSYHMQAAVQLQNGVSATDVDHTFTSGTPLLTPNLTVTTTAGMTPQPGVEALTPLIGSKGILVTDLQGNALWSYVLPNALALNDIEGVKLLPNGHFLITVGLGSTFPFANTPNPPGAIVAIREIDLAGNIVRGISSSELTDELQAKYAATGQSMYNLTLQQFHHDITPLPNGHWLVLANIYRSSASIPGYAGAPTTVLGDVIIDLDQNLQPVWAWNEFDHFDVNRRPMQFPDWTHTNAVVYTPDDHNILVSIRHQNWVVKVDYNDGAGTGNVLWRLGQGGDFTLVGGTNPTDWQYAQHNPSIVGSSSAGIFSLTLMDNGDDRMFPDGNLCGTGSEPACYTTIPVFRIDENAKTATLTFRQQLGLSLYSNWGGNAEPLANGNLEYDLAGVGSNSDIFEVTPDNLNPTTVWHLHSPGVNLYRGFRMPSLYPGVQW